MAAMAREPSHVYDDRYAIKVTPRKPTSKWSDVNRHGHLSTVYKSGVVVDRVREASAP